MVADGALPGLVRFRSTEGTVQETALGDVRAEDLAGALPWRTFRWHRGQQHFSGLWWSSTMTGHVVYESRLELARFQEGQRLRAEHEAEIDQIRGEADMRVAEADEARARVLGQLDLLGLTSSDLRLAPSRSSAFLPNA